MVPYRRVLLEPTHSTLSLRHQCKLLDINRSSYYYQPELIDAATLALMRMVDEVYTRYPFFGSRQMARYLCAQGQDVGRTKIRGIYERLGLQASCPGPHTSTSHPAHKKYPYLLRGMSITDIDQVWSTDITFIRLRKGFVYLMAIIDWFSRYVLDWELSISLEAEFCVDTLRRVLSHSKCDIFNTDQGAQFTSHDWIKTLQGSDIKISMDGKGRALDNVFVERLWRSVKYESVYLHEWDTVKEARRGLAEYFDFYNHVRPHSSLNGCTPGSVYLTTH